MAQNKVKFAVVGIGGLGRSHMIGINNNSDVAEIYAVCDNNEEILNRVANEFNVERRYLDFYEMIKDGGFDCVLLSTPDCIHREHAVAALEAGYHVLCEKPLAQTVEDCEAMVAAAKKSGKKFMTGQVCRKAPGFIKAKELVDSGAIGELFYVESEYAHDYQFLGKAWRWDPVNLRYSIIGGGCHAIDLLRWIAGDPEKVMALANRKVLKDWPVDDCTIAIMQFPNNVVGKIFCGIGVKRDYTMRTCLYGTKGTIICDNRNPTIKLYRHAITDNGEHIYPDKDIPVDIAHHNVSAEIKDMCDAILNDTALECDVYEGANTVAVGIAAVESAAQGGMPVAPRYSKR
ncbi:MAG: Gfo/Idh/MocA family oxidoreductase [Clostridia bacterium]|nr:Gfo/Idh/MocA family oxidoreductase [Clostridia bacterium]